MSDQITSRKKLPAATSIPDGAFSAMGQRRTAKSPTQPAASQWLPDALALVVLVVFQISLTIGAISYAPVLGDFVSVAWGITAVWFGVVTVLLVCDRIFQRHGSKAADRELVRPSPSGTGSNLR